MISILTFWVKLVLISIIVVSVDSLFKLYLKRVLKLDKVKRAYFFNHHVNNVHKKIDWSFRLVSTVILLILTYMMMYQDFSIHLFLGVAAIIGGVNLVIRAFFEWKYSENPKQALFTINDLVILIIAVISVMQFELFTPIV